MAWVFLSLSDQLIWPHSWRPYLSLELNKLSATFLRDYCLSEFLSLLIMNNFWFRLEITPPLPYFCVFIFWLSSTVMPRNLALFSWVPITSPTLIWRTVLFVQFNQFLCFRTFLVFYHFWHFSFHFWGSEPQISERGRCSICNINQQLTILM